MPMEAWGSYCVASLIVSTFYTKVESLAEPGTHRYWLGLASQLSLGPPFLHPKFWIRNGLPTFPGRRQVIKERRDNWDTEGHRESYRANRRGLTKRSRRKKPPLSCTLPLSSWMLLMGHIWLQDIVDGGSLVKPTYISLQSSEQDGNFKEEMTSSHFKTLTKTIAATGQRGPHYKPD